MPILATLRSLARFLGEKGYTGRGTLICAPPPVFHRFWQHLYTLAIGWLMTYPDLRLPSALWTTASGVCVQGFCFFRSADIVFGFSLRSNLPSPSP